MGNIFKGLHTVCVYGKEYFCLSYCHTVTAATPRYTRNRKGTNVGEMFAYLLLLTGLPTTCSFRAHFCLFFPPFFPALLLDSSKGQRTSGCLLVEPFRHWWPYFLCPVSKDLALWWWAPQSLSYIIRLRNAQLNVHSHPEKMLVLFHQSYTILQTPHITTMTITSCHDPGLNLQYPDENTDTLTP